MMQTRTPAQAATLDLRSLVEEFFRTSFSTDNPLITMAVRRMLNAGGKRLRPLLTLLAAEACGGDPREHLPLAAYMELIHVATLIHDDVVDRAQTRRGINATNVDFGNRVSVLAGDYLFAWIFRNVTRDYPHPIPHILSSTLADITDGEVLQMRALGNLDTPPSAYIDIVVKKTAVLFAGSAECGAIMGGAEQSRVQALRDFGMHFGIAFQILDDILDMTATQEQIGKPPGNDLREHKMTLPLILALQTGDAALRDAVERFYAEEQAPENTAHIGEIIARIAEAGGIAQATNTLDQHVEQAKASLTSLGNIPGRSNLEELADALTRKGKGLQI
jgi:octaprenyl-diphosphate synthase